MNFLVIMIVIWFGMSFVGALYDAYLMSKRTKDVAEKEGVEIISNKNCPPHKWTYRDGQPMQCKLCKFVAGSHSGPGGNYGI